MPRYIDLEELEKRINDNIKPETPEEKALIEWCKDECIRQAYAMPRADVVPKSEVEREIFGEIEKNECHDLSGKTTMYMLFADEFAELKKKYT